ncbi:MAG: 5-(carboxyamino)imidazole ribonucleotide synthase [Alphaproteobacteria bacterium]|uniref:5-(carboxyamino)imidazole ribonucleotide synthase n=1 Tax=Devosia sp. XGJD_8 TaxID=3391187 RepID=UPI001D8235E8|nr:5-(carboxyamino)imidazole ribonucleotide synthase [Alphaproteobacteria bacterium]MBU1560314.1 5-(carboxyamino)imidazole ribonucleotide synthase [Alphaproteobacteria bacterium]MBU2303639.1 5-(carboxyamino)imidazole ribonucleotide synthase [Alphaproteobacteria bacterium]MBU2366238.1 5-(carboxyamino)imidazole ribonucleotide synthase [Alphaproteobacteria bacterium]
MADDISPLPAGSTIGILGGGQLGRMLSLAASRLGMRTHIFCPDPDSPAFEVTPHKTVAAYDDEAALAAFADAVDVITYEFENVPAATAEFLAARKPLRPGANALAVSQDRLAEKGFLASKNIPVAPYRAVETLADLDAAMDALGLPAVLKTTRLGYDGKGQRVIRERADAAAAFAELSPKPLVLEAFIPFDKEISVVVARNVAGEVRAFDAAENVHRHHILFTSTVPADIAPGLEKHAAMLAKVIVVALDYVGVLGVEFFVVPGERPTLLVNEIAPRVHNSGHWTEAVCLTDQFEQHIRAVLGWPLGDPARMADVVMENLVGDEVLTVPTGLDGNTQPHLYGKTAVRAGRKMGHVNRIVRRG